MEQSKVEKARKAAGISQVAAGAITNMTNITFAKKEKDPYKFTLEEFFRLYHEVDSDSQALMWAELENMRDRKIFSYEM